MGFKKAAPMPPVTTIPVVSETTTEDTRNDYEQSKANKKGLLSTILTARREATPQGGSNKTLG